MPEGLEAEIWCRAAEAIVGRTITDAWVDGRVAPAGFQDAVFDASVSGVRRMGKVVLLDTDGPTIGLRFGMTGKLVIDGISPIANLEYASSQNLREWDRLRLFATDPGSDTVARTSFAVPALRLNDPRRLARISLDPDLSHLGLDIFLVSCPLLTARLTGRTKAIKIALLDQGIVAGLGNLTADEVLWWASLDPHRSCSSLDSGDIERLADAIRVRLPIMLRRGGSTEGVLSPAIRSRCPPCPRDGGDLRRACIGGRTAVWCTRHQR